MSQTSQDTHDEDEDEVAPHSHGENIVPKYSDSAVERAVRLFRALGDEARLRTLGLLIEREACVTELAAASDERVSTVSHRLRLLRTEGLVKRRREGRHIYYALADHHVIELVQNALDHVTEED